jgi:Xaa-Pro dipeptidase
MGVLDRVMLIKDKAEIELLRRAAEIADTGMETAFASIALGRTELEVTGYAEAAMRAAGNEFVWSVTGTELGSGYRQWYEEGFTVMPSTKRIQRGDVVTVDVHSMHECYLGDLALNAVVGNPSPEIQKLAAAWQGVANSIIDQLRPDVVISDIARNARRTADELGYGAYVTPFFGHGLGTDARIPHVITESNTAPLEANMMVEVLIQMTVPGLAGLRLETAALITEEGHELLNKVPVELRVIDPDRGRGSLRLA